MIRTLVVSYYALVGVLAFFFFINALTQQPDTKLPTREPIHRRF